MKPLEFKEQNLTYAKDQPPYIPLPGHKIDEPEGGFIFCMGLSFRERCRVLFNGRIWVRLLTFNKPLTPSAFSTKKTDFFIMESHNRILRLFGYGIFGGRIFRIGTKLTSKENGELIEAPEGTPDELIVGTVR